MEQTMKVVLELQDQPSNVRRITVRHDIVIGRGSDCNLRLSAPQISRRHCFLRVGREGVSVTDLDSSNGTYLDGKRLKAGKREEIANGASLSLGPIRFIVHVRDEAVSADVLKPAPLKDAVESPPKSPMSLGIERAAPSAEPDESTASLSGPAKALRMALGDAPPDMLSRAEIIDLGKLKDSGHGAGNSIPTLEDASQLDEMPTVAPGGMDHVDVLNAAQEVAEVRPELGASLADATWFSGGDSANSMPVQFASSASSAPMAEVESVEVIDDEVAVVEEVEDVEVVEEADVVEVVEVAEIADEPLECVEVVEDFDDFAMDAEVVELDDDVVEVVDDVEVVEAEEGGKADDEGIDPELSKFLKGF